MEPAVEVVTVWHAFAPEDGHLSTPARQAALHQLPKGTGLAGAKVYHLDETPSRLLSWYETTAVYTEAATKEAAVPVAASRRLWDLTEADGERMVLRLKRDVGTPTSDGATWLYQVHTDIPEGIAAEYNEWNDHEHLPRLVTVPGVLRARRYVAVSGEGPRYLTAYDLSDRDAFESPAGLIARKTLWTAKMRSVFQNTRRSMCRLVVPPK